METASIIGCFTGCVNLFGTPALHIRPEGIDTEMETR